MSASRVELGEPTVPLAPNDVAAVWASRPSSGPISPGSGTRALTWAKRCRAQLLFIPKSFEADWGICDSGGCAVIPTNSPASDHTNEGKINGLISTRLHRDRPHFVHSCILGHDDIAESNRQEMLS